MSTKSLLTSLAKELADQVKTREPGYCLRVDHLAQQDAEFLCEKVISFSSPNRCYLLTSKNGSELGPTELNTERAIELRNRKPASFVLIVPFGMTDSTASSLRNAFAVFELDDYWRQFLREQVNALPDDVRRFVSRALQLSRLPGVSEEDRAAYVSAVACSSGSITASHELCRIGLIPDSSSDFERLEANARAVRELVRPVKSYSSLSERLEHIGVQPGLQRRTLESFLDAYQLSDWRTWLRDLADRQQNALFFSSWDLLSRSKSSLRRLNITSWLDGQGVVHKWSKLRQEEVGTQPYAAVGQKGEIQVRWESDPKSPEGLDKWRVEMIPSLDFYAESEVPDVALPVKSVKGSLKRTTLKLSAIDWPDDTSSMVVQVRLTPQSETGGELTDKDDNSIVAISDEIQLRPADSGDGTEAQQSSTAKGARDLSLAKLRLQVESQEPDTTEASYHWSGSGENQFNLSVGSGQKIRIHYSLPLKSLEEKTVHAPSQLGLWRAKINAGATLAEEVVFDGAPMLVSLAAHNFLNARGAFFDALVSQGPRKWVAIADWNDALTEIASAYVRSHQDWLSSARGDELKTALAVDTGVLRLRSDGRVIPVGLTSPLNPLSVAWWMQYQRTLKDIRERVDVQESPSSRREKIDLAGVEILEPVAFPAITMSVDGMPRLSVGCLDFLWTVSLPIGWPDPARALALIARVLGAKSDEQPAAEQQTSRCASHVRNYLETHPYTRKLRVVTDNAGDGEFSSAILRESVADVNVGDGDEADRESGIETIDLLAHFREPLPSSLPGLVPLRDALEQRGSKTATTSLQPLLETAIRSSQDLQMIPGGGAHLTLQMDITHADLRFERPSRQRSKTALNGLFSPLQLSPGGPPWQYVLPDEGIDDGLTSLQRNHQMALAAAHTKDESRERLPVLQIAIAGNAERVAAIHEQSDWVMTLDRFVDPAWIESNDGMRYLLDYSPDVSDGLSRRLIVTTAHRSEAENIVGDTLQELGFEVSHAAVTSILNRLRQISGRLALKALATGSSRREVAALAIAMEKLDRDGELLDCVLIPVDSHIEMFSPVRRRGRPEAGRRCDLILAKPIGPTQIGFQLVEVKGRTHRPSPDVFAAIQEQLDSTRSMINKLWRDSERYDRPIQLYRLRKILEHHLRRAIGFGTVRALSQWSSILENVCAGKVNIELTCKGVVVCSAAMPESFTRGDTKIEVIGDLQIASRTDEVSSQPVASEAFVRPEEPKDEQPSMGERWDSSDEHSEDGSRWPSVKFDSNVDVIDKELSATADEAQDVKKSRVATATVAPPKSEVPKKPSSGGLLQSLAKDLLTDTEEVPSVGPGLLERLETEARPAHQSTMKSKNDRIDSEKTRSPPKPVATTEIDVMLGDGQDGPVSWKPSVTGSPHLFVIGIPGQGKSVTTTRLLCELTKQNVPALVLDFHGEFANENGPFALAARPSVLNAADGLPFSILEPKHGKGPRAKEAIWELAEICQYVCSLGDIQRDAVFRAMETAYGATAENSTPLLSAVAELINDDEDDGNAKNVAARCRPLFEFGLFADEPTEAIYDQFLQGAVIDLHELKSETLQLAAGAFTLRKLYRAMFGWGPAKRIRLAIVLDEAHRLARDITLPKIMKEGRKFGIAVVVASQDVRDFHEQVLSNAGTKVIFRVNFPDSRKVAGFVRAAEGASLSKKIERLSVGEAIVQTPSMMSAEQVRMRRVDQ